MRGDVGGRGAGREGEKSNPAGDQARVGHLSYPQRAIDSFGEQIEMALVAGQRQLEIRVACEETRQRGTIDRAGDECRSVDAHSPVRHGAL